MLDVLMYIFENYIGEQNQLGTSVEVILSEMEREGFSREQIFQAIHWFSDLCEPNHQLWANGSFASTFSIRYFAPQEIECLGVEGADFLLYLQRMGVLDDASRELVLDRVMALGYREIQIAHLKWVVLMVLFNDPQKKSELELLKSMVLQEAFQNEKKH